MSSDIGPIPTNGGDYLKLLVAIRSVVERKDTISKRREELTQLFGQEQWESIVSKLGGSAAIANRFFPTFLSTIPGLQAASMEALVQSGLTTPIAIGSASDEKLLAVKGIGPAKLKNVRAMCAAASDPDNEYVDRVIR